MITAPEAHLKKRHLATVRVLGLPKGQPRPRAFARGGRAAVYDPGTAEGWKSEIAQACREFEGRGLHQPVEFRITFFMPRPKSHFGTNGRIKTSSPAYIYDKKPDADNLAKAVMDALTAIHVWVDDSQVVDLIVLKRWATAEHPPGCSFIISELMEVIS